MKERKAALLIAIFGTSTAVLGWLSLPLMKEVLPASKLWQTVILLAVTLLIVIALTAKHVFSYYVAFKLTYPILLKFYSARDETVPRVSAFLAFNKCVSWGNFSGAFDAARIYIEFHLCGMKDEIEKHLPSICNGGHEPRTIPNLFVLTNQLEQIESYFHSVMEAKPDDGKRDRFLLELCIRDGFLAYNQLLSGILTTYGDDWNVQIDQFDIDSQNNNVTFKKSDFKRSQLYIFYCWLLWGPSVPIGKCRQWIESASSTFPAIQCGFGDDANSLPLLKLVNKSDDDGNYKELLKKLASSPLAVDFHDLRVRPVYVAADKGHENTPEVKNSLKNVGQAQRSSFESITRRTGMVLLDYCKSDPANYSLVDPKKYYSAYVWVLFVIVDELGKPVFGRNRKGSEPNDTHPWHGLIPFFEHGNLADDNCYALFKQQLAAKALASIELLVSMGCEQNATIEGMQKGSKPKYLFRYACAIDDTNCADDDCRNVHSAQFKSAKLIKEYFNELLEEKHNNVLKYLWHEKDNQGKIDISASSNDVSSFSACHLCEVIESFYTSLDKSQVKHDSGVKLST